MPGAAHFVTYRLADTLPVDVLARLRAERDSRLRQPPPSGVALWEHRANAHNQYFAAYDRYLDRTSTIRWLENSAVAQIVVANLYHHHHVKYQLLEYVVMPNHVHVLLVPIIAEPELNGADASSVGHGHVADAASVRIHIPTRPTDPSSTELFSDESDDTRSPLSKIMHSLKSYTANQANDVLGRKGRFWQRESYDHWVRNDAELARIAEYIANNAVKARLTANPWDWPYCSAYDRKHPRSKRLTEWW
jgi:putative DNA methylase